MFESSRSGREALYAVRPDGSGLSRLPLELPPDGAEVSWTRDGAKALVMYDTGNGAVAAYVFDPATGARRPFRVPGLAWGDVGDLTLTPWSPDGKRLVVATDGGDLTVDLQTGTRRPVSDERNTDLVTWSADGKDILFPSGGDVYAAPADGGPARLLVGLGDLEPGDLRASGDGKWISFERYGERDALFVVRTDGSGLRLIARDAESAAWSPAGARLAFADSRGVVVMDVDSGRRRRPPGGRLADPGNARPEWSPDGDEVLYWRNDLGYGATESDHLQLWRVKWDGSGAHAVTHAFPDGAANEFSAWVSRTLVGKSPARLPLFSLPAARTLTTALPIVALGVEGDRAAVAQGFGTRGGLHAPLGPIVVWNARRGTSTRVAVRGCGSAYDVVLAAGRVGYRCDNTGEGYVVDAALRLGRSELVQTHGSEFAGTFLGGIAADGGTTAFDVEDAGSTGHSEFRIHETRLWTSNARRKRRLRTFPGRAWVASIDNGRIAVVREGAVSILGRDGRLRTFPVAGRVLDAALDGRRLVILQSTRLLVLDVASGRRTASWPVRRAFGPDPELANAQGGLAAYVVGAAAHVLRLADGREIVLDTPTATEPTFARFGARGLFYAYNESYARRPGRLVFLARSELEHALDSVAASG